MTTVGHRYDFGKDWDEVVRDWCLGVSLPLESDKAWETLEALEHLWPERLGEVLTRCQVPESLHTKIRVNKGESEGDVPQQTDSVSDTLDSHEAAFDCKN